MEKKQSEFKRSSDKEAMEEEQRQDRKATSKQVAEPKSMDRDEEEKEERELQEEKKEKSIMEQFRELEEEGMMTDEELDELEVLASMEPRQWWESETAYNARRTMFLNGVYYDNPMDYINPTTGLRP